MYGYKLEKPSGQPKVVWAINTSVVNYSWHNNNNPNMIEFSISNASKRIIKSTAIGEVELVGNVFSCYVGDVDISSSADDGVAVDILSIAIEFDNLKFELKELLPADFEDNTVLLLPFNMYGLLDGEICEYERLLNRFTHCYMQNSVASQLECSAIIFELLSKLDSITRRSNSAKKEKYVNYYVMKADSIILQKYDQKLTQRMIASELGITPSYLSSIFKSSMGVGFSDRLFEVRMKQAEQLVSQTSLNAQEIALRVGFEDESHLRRRFKQYFGAGIREYRCILNEQTLYHDKPQRKIDI